jgi:hypothetical protein
MILRQRIEQRQITMASPLKGIYDYKRPDRCNSSKKYPEGIEDVKTVKLVAKKSQDSFLEKVKGEKNRQASPH